MPPQPTIPPQTLPIDEPIRNDQRPGVPPRRPNAVVVVFSPAKRPFKGAVYFVGRLFSRGVVALDEDAHDGVDEACKDADCEEEGEEEEAWPEMVWEHCAFSPILPLFRSVLVSSSCFWLLGEVRT
ncbi:hypothetical protein CCMA1212_008133 [Trichoderma ghanense]|uniref:Uncharacterized protein n=1 Tax=Trichoderma ghanense TaxID=65468 RepID=A0ABY2GWH6_9HYPO